MNWFQNNRKKMFLFVIAIFVVGSFAGFGSYFLTESPYDAAIVVNNRKIPYKTYQTLYQRVVDEQRERSTEPLTDQHRNFLKQQVVQSLIQGEVFLMEAEALGIQVTDMELAQVIQHIPAFQKDGRFDVRAYQEILSRMRMKVEDFEAEQRRQLMAQKTQFTMAAGVKISSLELPSKVQAALAQATEENRKKIVEDMDGFKETVRRQEIQAALQGWYNDQSSRLKVKVLLNKLEGTPSPPPPAAPASPVAQ